MYVEIVEKANVGWNRDQLDDISIEDVAKEKVIKKDEGFFLKDHLDYSD